MNGGIPELSVVVPAFNERRNLAALAEEARLAFLEGGIAAELILVDDGSTDGSSETLVELAASRPWIRPLLLPRRTGQSAALLAGIEAARGRFLATLDADLQNDPADLPWMLEILRRGEADMVQGVRVVRRDSGLRRGASLLGRVALRVLLRSRFRDTGCATRVFTAEVARALPLHFRGMHRFLPVYVHLSGARVLERPVSHRPRQQGETKYGLWDRLPGLVDCLAVRWMARRYQRPGSRRPEGPGP